KRQGIPVTRPARTLLDLAAVASGRQLEDAVDDALCRRLVGIDALRARIAEADGRRGVRSLRPILAAWGPGPLPGSLAEVRALRWLLGHGAPMSVRQYVIHDELGRFVARVDNAWPQFRVALETHSLRWHGTPRRMARDEVRE